jgi:hypothetical protein
LRDIVGSVKTTFDIPEPLLRDVQQLARERHTTTKSLVEQALLRLLDEHASSTTFVLGDGSVSGEGLNPEFADVNWAVLRDTAYGIEL